MKESKITNNRLNTEYRSRINSVIDYIEKNIDREFTLNELAQIAFFSKYHFHRIFSAVMNETLFDFIQRTRVEKAAYMLLVNGEMTVTGIAYACGFSSHSLFTRTFTNYFKMPPTEWRKNNSNYSQMKSNIRQGVSNKGKASDKKNMYVKNVKNQSYRRSSLYTQHQTAEVKELPDMTLAYVRHIGPYLGDSEIIKNYFKKLFRWANPRGLIGKDSKVFIIHHDHLKITKEDKLRLSISLVVPLSTEVSGDIGKMTFEGGKYAVTRFILAEHEFMEAWAWFYGKWFPQSGYQPDDRPFFESFVEFRKDGKFAVDLCVPVKPL